MRKRIKAASASGISPWLRDLNFLNCHHTKPYPSLALFMGKQGKWQAPPWQSGRQGKQQQQEGNSWSYWHGSWRSKPQKDTEDRKDGTIQFPDYNQIKIQEAQSSGLSSDQIMDVSEGEDVPGQDFVKFLQKLLNSARRADTKLRKIQQDRDMKERQWMEFQAALKAKFIEQRALFGKETKALEKEAMELQESKRLVLLQIQEVVTTGGSRHSEESKTTDKPTAEDLAAWDAFVLSPEAPSFSAEDDVIRRALHAARNPEAFMQGIPIKETQMANAVRQVTPGLAAGSFPAMTGLVTPKRRGGQGLPHTPLTTTTAPARAQSTVQLEKILPQPGYAAVQYAENLQRVTADPYIVSPSAVAHGNGMDASTIPNATAVRVATARRAARRCASPYASGQQETDATALADKLLTSAGAKPAESSQQMNLLAAKPPEVTSLQPVPTFSLVNDDEDEDLEDLQQLSALE